MIKLPGLYKNISLILISLSVSIIFLNYVQLSVSADNRVGNIKYDSNLNNSEHFSVDFKNELKTPLHKIDRNSKSVISIVENKNESQINSGTKSLTIITSLKFSISKLNLHLNRIIKYPESFIPELQTYKALQSDKLLI